MHYFVIVLNLLLYVGIHILVVPLLVELAGQGEVCTAEKIQCLLRKKKESITVDILKIDQFSLKEQREDSERFTYEQYFRSVFEEVFSGKGPKARMGFRVHFSKDDFFGFENPQKRKERTKYKAKVENDEDIYRKFKKKDKDSSQEWFAFTVRHGANRQQANNKQANKKQAEDNPTKGNKTKAARPNKRSPMEEQEENMSKQSKDWKGRKKETEKAEKEKVKMEKDTNNNHNNRRERRQERKWAKPKFRPSKGSR